MKHSNACKSSFRHALFYNIIVKYTNRGTTTKNTPSVFYQNFIYIQRFIYDITKLNKNQRSSRRHKFVGTLISTRTFISNR